jgi:hypothetical protein
MAGQMLLRAQCSPAHRAKAVSIAHDLCIEFLCLMLPMQTTPLAATATETTDTASLTRTQRSAPAFSRGAFRARSCKSVGAGVSCIDGANNGATHGKAQPARASKPFRTAQSVVHSLASLALPTLSLFSQ